MPTRLFALLYLPLVLLSGPARADAWTDGQAEWARHGSRHGAWDCNGSCPAGRGVRQRPGSVKTRLSIECQQNLEDGRTLISDGRLIPEGARSKIVSYRPTRREGGWSYGTCAVDVTR